MYKFQGQNFMDFVFRDKKLSDFGGFVGSADGGIKEYSVLPKRSYTTDKAIGSDIETVYASNLEPRVFNVPIVFEEITNGKLRTIAQWLDSPIPQKFQWLNDTVYINCNLDGSDFDAQTSSGLDAQIDLKFIAYDPFYYDIEEQSKTVTSVVSGQKYTYENEGYGKLCPYITLSCSGNVKIEILDSEDNVYTESNISDVTGGVIIDSTTLECTLLSGAPHFSHIDRFPKLPSGTFSIRITGTTISNLNLKYRQRYL